MIIFYDRDKRQYINLDVTEPINKSDFRKMLDEGKLFKIRNLLYRGLRTKFLYMTYENMRLGIFHNKTYIGYYYSETKSGNELVTLRKSAIVHKKDAEKVREACERDPKYDLIFRELSCHAPYNFRAISESYCLGATVLSDDMMNFYRAIMRFWKEANDDQRCYYELKRSDYGYPSITEVRDVLRK